MMCELFRAQKEAARGREQEIVMEMDMGMDSLWPHHQHPPPPLPPSSEVPDAFSYYCYYPPFAAAAAAKADNPSPPAVSRSRASRSRAVARKDRHSKICTAGGMRDRRMRLSLDVARRFFALQDKLGFDKASKTVQWLLDRSTAGINHLAASMSASMSLSEEDGDGSVLLDLDSNDHAKAMAADAETNKQQEQEHQTAKAKRRSAPAVPSPRKKSNNGGAPVLLPDKASRARARERARERTKERNRLRSEAPEPAPAPARQPVVPAAACSNNYYEEGEQEPWELGGVVFAKPRIKY
ncbi:hypothetical protein CFC21_069458 [Triticum aestivum]|uniref:TCP domain-containing protein n=3 Tax=Triticum aestivum TaxID=4565 RepID=A0A9R1HCI4_WHEAT|nr:hypothetical protein CFC21_069458 [Triticum aestivum]